VFVVIPAPVSRYGVNPCRNPDAVPAKAGIQNNTSPDSGFCRNDKIYCIPASRAPRRRKAMAEYGAIAATRLRAQE